MKLSGNSTFPMTLLRAFPLLTCLLFLGVVELSAEQDAEDSEEPTVELPRLVGELVWPKHWTVFAPMDQMDANLSSEFLKAVPEQITVPAEGNFPERVIEAIKVDVVPGETVDLLNFFETQRRGNVAYIFVELDSPKEQEVTFGIGGDWWLEVWVNGEPAFDTLDGGLAGGRVGGNVNNNISMLNHHFTAPLKAGDNVLAVRFTTGKGTSLIGIGGPQEFSAAVEVEQERLEKTALSQRPAFADRLVFPVETQAIASATLDLEFPAPEADLLAGSLVGRQEMPARQLYFAKVSENRGALFDTKERRFDTPVFLRISKTRFPWEDRALDAIVYTTPPEAGQKPAGSVEVLLKAENGEVLSRNMLEDLSPHGLFFSVGFPEALRGESGSLEVIWKDGNNVVGQAERKFQVGDANGVATSGKIPLRILNQPGATIDSAPMTVGLPFPQGALSDSSHVRLVDEWGQEIPVQTKVTGLWSRFGYIKWLLCDFTVDLEGQARTVFIEYGPGIKSAAANPIAVTKGGNGFPGLDTGRIRITDEGVLFDAEGKGNYQKVLASEALMGAFVKHEKGGRFAVPEGVEHAIEELGSEKAVVRQTGWFVDPNNQEQFCQFVTRLIFHRNSPVVRIFHTWIFTGDGNKDRIPEMGWKFDAASGAKPEGFLQAFGEKDWLEGEFVVQYNFDRYKLAGANTSVRGRLPGVLSARTDNARVLFGAKDFWQNFPSELGFEKNSFTFFNWPRHNPPASLPRPVPKEEAFRSRFAHEGELLDFRVPDEYVTGEIFEEGIRREGHWAEGRPETVNAQGIARTEEMFLYFSAADTGLDQASLVLQGLNDETLRAIVEPGWVASSGVFGKIHPLDVENYPEYERLFDLIYKAPALWVERLGFYGKWLHGDYATWNMKLDEQTVSTYRTLRKNHHTWPYRWVPFARSGDPELLKLTENATRQMTDANFCHFASEDVDAAVGPDHFRRQGWWLRSLLPWAGRTAPVRRSYTIDTDYIWDAYYMTGYARARDMLLLLQRLMPRDESIARGPRTTCSMLSSYIDMYEGTFDPYFLSASWEISDLYDHDYGGLGEVDRYDFAVAYDAAGHGWRGEQQKWADFTGDPEHLRLAMNNAITQLSPYRLGSRFTGASAGDGGAPAHLAAFAWEKTGDPYYLARAVAELDAARTTVYEGEIGYFRGTDGATGHGYIPMRNAGWDAPFKALAAIHGQEELPDRVPSVFIITGTRVSWDDPDAYHFELPKVFIQKQNEEPVSVYLDARSRRTESYDYAFTQTAGEASIVGQWQPPVKLEIPAKEPSGTYEVKLSGSVPVSSQDEMNRTRRRAGFVFFPITEPEIPEVVAFPRSPQGIATNAGIQGYWFMVPEGTREFWVRFDSGRPTDRLSVWDSEGGRVYDGYRPAEETTVVTLPVKSGQDGKLWRVTGGRFVIDPQIPPYFSVTQSKWFLPELREDEE